jgi:uncharacterized protein
LRFRAALSALLLALAPAAAQEPAVVTPKFKTGPAAPAQPAPSAKAAPAQPAPAQPAPAGPLEEILPTEAQPAPKQKTEPPRPPRPATDAAPEKGLSFPALSGRVVDAANILPTATRADIEAKSAALEARTGAQFVVATVPSLGGYEIEEYGYQLGRAWGIGRQGKSDGVILLVAPNERRVRLEIGYGLEPILTDALSSRIIRNNILPAFRAGDLAGGVAAGADAVLAQLGAQPADAQAAAAAAEREQRAQRGSGPGFGSILWLLFLAFFVLPLIFRRSGRRRRVGGMPVVLWGPGLGGWGGGRSSGWGGGGFGGGGGFSGGGGSFGGGGSSGSW